MILQNAVQTANQYLSFRLSQACCCVDATAGNGKDTLFLAKNSPAQCCIWSFDIQQLAINRTRELLTSQDLIDKVHLVLDSHENIAEYIYNEVDVGMFNLGYLPRSERSIVTRAETSLRGIQAAMRLLKVGGVISVVAYPGHMEGQLEQRQLEMFLTEVSQKQYHIGCWAMINQKNKPPLLYMIERRESQDIL